MGYVGVTAYVPYANVPRSLSLFYTGARWSLAGQTVHGVTCEVTSETTDRPS